MKPGTPVRVIFPDGWKRKGWYYREGRTMWHRISSSTTKGKLSSAGWWCLGRKQDQAAYFEAGP